MTPVGEEVHAETQRLGVYISTWSYVRELGGWRVDLSRFPYRTVRLVARRHLAIHEVA